jgi:ABC-type branched-subunit amino acid transport system ATPase component
VIAAYLRSDDEEPEVAEPPVGATPVVSRPTRTPTAAPEALLAARELAVGYHGRPVVRGLEFEVRSGEVVALLGANRAGKTTALLGLAGEILPLEGEVYWLGKRVSKRVPLHKRAAHGLGFVTDERSVFMQLTVAENLRLGRCDPAQVTGLFPELETMLKRRAGLLSGGQQQMLGLGRALARHPKVLLVDELSLGLAPMVVTRLMDALRHAADEHGVGVVLVEQHVQQALRIADRVCVIAGGQMTLTGTVDEVGDSVADAFLADVLGIQSPEAVAIAEPG